MRALGEKSKCEPPSGTSPLTPSRDLAATQVESSKRSSKAWFPEELKKREDFKTSVGRRHIEGALQGAFPEAGHIIPISVNKGSKKVWIVNNPTMLPAHTLTTYKLSEFASNWDIIKAFSGVGPADFAGDNVNKLSNAILFDATEHRMFGQFDFCLKQSVNRPTYPCHYLAPPYQFSFE